MQLRVYVRTSVRLSEFVWGFDVQMSACTGVLLLW